MYPPTLKAMTNQTNKMWWWPYLELGRIVCKLPLAPGTMMTLYNAPERFNEAYFVKYPVSESLIKRTFNKGNFLSTHWDSLNPEPIALVNSNSEIVEETPFSSILTNNSLLLVPDPKGFFYFWADTELLFVRTISHNACVFVETLLYYFFQRLKGLQ